MSIAAVSCRAQLGLEAPLVRVEVSLSAGLPAFNIVGLPAMVVKESKDRVRSALVHSGFNFPAGRITVSLSPADMPKRGGRFDLPIAVGILLASQQLRAPAHGLPYARQEFYGELGLNGELKAVPGLLLAAAQAAREARSCGEARELFVPQASGADAQILLRREGSGISIRAPDHLLAVCSHIEGTRPLPALARMPEASVAVSAQPAAPVLDLGDVRGQLQAKRALTIAAAGSHSILMIGPPGVGKSMLALRLPGLLPPLSEEEALEVAAIAAASGVQAGPFGRRPIRVPHHTTSAVALIGGGARARPGEISLAHHGVLFLDELLEFDRRALEALREPLESGQVSISRAGIQAQYPAQFQLVAAMNPCPCGRLGDPSELCACTPAEVARYRARVSAPLLERLDIHLEVPRVLATDFNGPAVPAESSACIAERVRRAREIQVARQRCCNSRLADGQLERICRLDGGAREVLERAMQALRLSARSRQRILRLARTIADLGGEPSVTAAHVSEAITYRSLDRKCGPLTSPAPPCDRRPA